MQSEPQVSEVPQVAQLTLGMRHHLQDFQWQTVQH